MAGPAAPLASVVGGGILGSLSALTLARLGFAVDWHAPSEAPERADGAQARVYALSTRTVGLLRDLGIWRHLDGKTQAVPRMEVHHVAPSAQIDLVASDAGADWLSQMVSHADLLAACETVAAGAPGIQRLPAFASPGHRLGDGVRDLDRILPKGALVVAADGSQSRLRRAAGLTTGIRHYEQMALVAAFQTDEPHRGVACQWFRPEGILALLPTAHPHQVSMVYSMASPQAEKWLGLSPDLLAERVADQSAHRFGRLHSVGPAVVATPLILSSAHRFAVGRLFLVGDAGHTVHPLAGYGLNLGILDLLDLRAQIQALLGEGRQLTARLTQPALLRALARGFNASRCQQVGRVQWALDGLQRLVMSQWPGLAQTRSLGMRMVQGLPELRGWLADSGRLTLFDH